MVITMIMYAKIQRMYFREKLSINEIARRTSLSRNTIKKWLRAAEGSEPQYRRREVPTKLSPFEDQLKQALLTDSHCPKRDRRTALMLFAELKKAGYDVSYTRVTNYVRKWREAGTSSIGKSAFAAQVPVWRRLHRPFRNGC